jgi:hypothetical protein
MSQNKKDIPYEQALKQARKTATVFGILAVVALVSLVYAFFMRTEANKVRVLYEVGLLEYKQRAEKAEKELENQKKQLETALQQAKDAALKAEENYNKSITRK